MSSTLLNSDAALIKSKYTPLQCCFSKKSQTLMQPIGHVQNIKTLKWIRGFCVKITKFFKFLLSHNPQKRMGYKVEYWCIGCGLSNTNQNISIFIFKISKLQATIVQRVDNAIHWINCYPVDNCSQNKLRYPSDSDLSGGWCYPPFEQLGPGLFFWKRFLEHYQVGYLCTIQTHEIYLNNLNLKN